MATLSLNYTNSKLAITCDTLVLSAHLVDRSLLSAHEADCDSYLVSS